MLKLTKEILQTLCPQGKESIIEGVVTYFNKYASDYGINSSLRMAHFFAQAAHEADNFKTLEEYASGAAYEGRKDLGNIHKGDGRRYKGRGMFQLTGRANYKEFGTRLGIDLINNPELAATAEISVRTALEYWKKKTLNTYADKNDITTITKRINGGLNGFADRKYKYKKIKELIDNVRIQQRLVDLGYTHLEVDGRIGKKTTEAIEDFQKKNGLKPDGVVGFKTLSALFKN